MEQIVFKTKKGNPATDSLSIAKGFGKTHGNVLQAIDGLECDADFNRMNFHSINYTDSRNRKQRRVVMTRDGFAFLVLGFTGKRAAKFKQDFIEQFDRMETQLKSLQPRVIEVSPAGRKARTKKMLQIGQSAAAIAQRDNGVVARKTFTARLKEHGVNFHGYRTCTHAIYQPLFGGGTTAIKQKYELPKGANVRDHLDVLDLATLTFIEALSAERLRAEGSYGTLACEQVCNQVAQSVKNTLLNTRRGLNA